MFSDKFAKAVEMLQKEFALERSVDEKVCIDKNGNPIPWYTYPAIEYLSQFDFSDKTVFEFGCAYSSVFWAERAKKVISVEDNPIWYARWKSEFKNSKSALVSSNLSAQERSPGRTTVSSSFTSLFQFAKRRSVWLSHP